MLRISYVELPVKDVAGVRDFYAGAFGWDFTDFGPEYSATTSGDTDLGLNGDQEQATAGILPIIEVTEDLEGALEKVVAAGGTITLPIFPYPGGRRFHFKDPHGHELGVFINEPEAH
ncbi:VOC family protein [Sphingomonas sp. G-3-2-10]|uniref:VOC family protein n=1 Tax=Sphingomonas sp. G-3-2-10 TaxID=2728838 RepID=UPI00146B3998|nr:VOC family protein [Sphingomonas sp. G-3-2-10]NML05470.1 VOC family protein [Sphingomonas sp. G-3-2-10]